MSVRIVTDSGCDLAPDVTDSLGIGVVPLSIRFGDTEFVDRVDLTPEQFYAEMAARDELPETAAPAPGAFAEMYQKLADEGATNIVVICLSEALSATGQAARTAAADAPVEVTIFDSKSATVGQGTIVLKAAEVARDGGSVDDVLQVAEDLRNRIRVLGVLDTLDNLKKGGRIGNAQALLGGILSIKPCIDLSSGVVEEAGRQRTRKKALAWLAEQIPAGATNVVVGHGMADDLDRVLEAIDADIDRVSLIGPVVGTHGGPGVIGLSFIV